MNHKIGEKLKILADAAKYDVSCSSSGSKRKNTPDGLGNATGMGICHTCNTKLVSGSVRDLRTGKLIIGAGSIVQTCVCAAAGDCELDQ